MIALILIPLALVFALSNVLEDEVERVIEENGLDGFNPDEESIYDDKNVEFGTNTPDELIGTPEDDVLFALGQADVVYGLAGDDLIEAGTNNDTVFGGEGDDILGGGSGADELYGDAGDDALLGNSGDDLLVGRGGDDLLIGGGGADSLNGGPGDDLLISGNVEPEDDSERDLTATALAVLRASEAGAIEDVDFDALEAEGALNGVDVSFLNERPEETQGGELNGGAGDDTLILTGGDTASGGSGEDLFVLNEDMAHENTVFVRDFISEDDVIAIEYDGSVAPEFEVRDREEDAVIFLGDDIIARIEGAAGLTISDLRLVQAA
ncbi:calcium-binding protein [Planktotalea sp.]|uniref:calcium-binding protein n=1 Tax=Planktotalea sp. TaxID=2029877 RepID=UPI003D6BD79C